MTNLQNFIIGLVASAIYLTVAMTVIYAFSDREKRY